MSVVGRFREQTRANASVPVTLWAIAMSVVLVLEVVSPSRSVTITGFGLTGLLGVSLGWRRRVGAVFYAPIVSWLFAWFPLMIASMVHEGVLKGFFSGLLLISFGWLAIGFVEFVWLAIVAFVVRALRGSVGVPDVVIVDPPSNASGYPRP